MNNRDHRSQAAATLLHMPRAAKRLSAVLVDIALCALTVWLALCLRLEHWVQLTPSHVLAIMGAVLIALPLFIRFGLYRAIFRYTGIQALLTTGKAVAIYGAVLLLTLLIVVMLLLTLIGMEIAWAIGVAADDAVGVALALVVSLLPLHDGHGGHTAAGSLHPPRPAATTTSAPNLIL